MMELTILESSGAGIRAGYSCPCGCTPSVAYERGGGAVADGCCCGNHFAVGPKASFSLTPGAGFRLEATPFQAPWGEGLEAAWLVGPSVHGATSDHEHGHEGAHDLDGDSRSEFIDPVCGMTVDAEAARDKGLHSSYQGRDFFFCGKGCKLEFDDDPERYLDPSHVPGRHD
jgi:YHS domain-containing protein